MGTPKLTFVMFIRVAVQTDIGGMGGEKPFQESSDAAFRRPDDSAKTES